MLLVIVHLQVSLLIETQYVFVGLVKEVTVDREHSNLYVLTFGYLHCISNECPNDYPNHYPSDPFLCLGEIKAKPK